MYRGVRRTNESGNGAPVTAEQVAPILAKRMSFSIGFLVGSLTLLAVVLYLSRSVFGDVEGMERLSEIEPPQCEYCHQRRAITDEGGAPCCAKCQSELFP